MDRNRYSARRTQHVTYDAAGKRSATTAWTGWVNHAGTTTITETPGTYRTKGEAVATIKAQHP